MRTLFNNRTVRQKKLRFRVHRKEYPPVVLKQDCLDDPYFPAADEIELYERVFWTSFQSLPEICQQVLTLSTDYSFIVKDKTSLNQTNMKGYKQFSEDYFSKILSFEEIKLYESGKMKAPETENEYQILIKGREFLKARTMIHRLENDPDLPLAKEMVKDYFARENKKQARKLSFRKGIFLLFSALAVLIWLSFLMMHIYIRDPLSRMYSWYYTPIQTVEFQNLDAVTEADQFLYTGLLFYEEGNYSLAVEKLSHAGSSNYYLGLSYMGMGEYDEAQYQLEVSFNENSTHPGVNWYLGLTYLKLSNPYRAIIHFRRLFLTDNPYQISALRIIRKLEKYIESETKST